MACDNPSVAIEALISGYIAGLLTTTGVVAVCAVIWRLAHGSSEKR